MVNLGGRALLPATKGEPAKGRDAANFTVGAVQTVCDQSTQRFGDMPQSALVKRAPTVCHSEALPQKSFVGGVSDADFVHYHKPLWRHHVASGAETPPTDF